MHQRLKKIPKSECPDIWIRLPSCDKRLARLISYIHHTSEYWHFFVVWETQHNNTDLDCFKTLILQETLKTRSQHQEEFCAFSEAEHLCQRVGCARNKPQFHTVPLKQRKSLNAGLRKDKIPALVLWDLVIEVFNSSPNQPNKTKDVRKPREM